MAKNAELDRLLTAIDRYLGKSEKDWGTPERKELELARESVGRLMNRPIVKYEAKTRRVAQESSDRQLDWLSSIPGLW